jgi:hypothetical protein
LAIQSWARKAGEPDHLVGLFCWLIKQKTQPLNPGAVGSSTRPGTCTGYYGLRWRCGTPPWGGAPSPSYPAPFSCGATIIRLAGFFGISWLLCRPLFAPLPVPAATVQRHR